ncbi:MAG TPA: SDR family oxidoreductase [Actinomycetota bacterium]
MTWGPFGVKGKNVIVTGGAVGIGRGIVDRFIEGGANVLLADLDGDQADAAASKLAGSPGRAVAMTVDVSHDGAGTKMVERCVAEFGSVDVLVNNAGIYPQIPMVDMTSEMFDRVYRINLRGLAFASQAAAKQMIAQGAGGVIVNISSIDAFRPSMVGLAAYDASKGGVTMFTKNLALELAPHGIRVIAIAPGGIRTEGVSKPMEGSGMTPQQQDEMIRAFIERIPMKRMGEPDDIATVAVFLASSGAGYITGTTIVVDGGALLT